MLALSDRMLSRHCPKCKYPGLEVRKLMEFEGVLIKCKMMGWGSNHCDFALILYVREPDNNRRSV